MSNANKVPGKKHKGAGCLRWLGRVALGAVILLLGLAAIGVIYQGIASARDAKLYKPVNQMVDVNGIQMRLDCRGVGSPTVVLEAGAQEWSTHWGLVQVDVAKFTRVCSYDRVGYGWSDAVGEQLNPQQVAMMLHTLLEIGGEEPPYLMVGHSFGGVFIRAFTAQYPDEVVGMVLVDSSHDNQIQLLPTEFAESPEVAQERNTMLVALRINEIIERLGLFRAFKLYDPVIASIHLSEKDNALLLTEMYQTGYFGAIMREAEMNDAYLSQPRELRSLGDMPLIVLTQKLDAQDMIAQISPTLQTMELAQQLADIYNDTQDELTALSTRGKRIVVEDAGHNIQLEQPEVVIDAIQEVFEYVAK